MGNFGFVPEFSSLEKIFERGLEGVLDIDVFNSLEDVDVDYQGNYLFFDGDSNCMYVGKAGNIKRRMGDHIEAWGDNKKTIDRLEGSAREDYEDNPMRFGVKGVGVDSIICDVEFVVTFKNFDGDVWEKFLIRELDPACNKNTYVSEPDGDNPDCPDCGNKLYWRSRERGYVCKNWRCVNYHKLGRGRVFGVDGNLIKED